MRPTNRPSKFLAPLLALVALAAVAVVSSGCGTTTADTARGRTLFIQKCGVCHTLAQAGTTAQVGPNLDAAFAAARAEGNDSDTVEGVVKAQVEFPRENNGNPRVSMPADVVTGQDLDDVAAYVGEWAGVPGAEPPKVAGGLGAQVFANNGCGGCHTLKAAESGGVTGPDLDEVLPDQSEAMIHESIVDPNKEIAKGYPPNVMPQNFEQLLSEKELEELVEYLSESTGAGSSGAKSKG
ncbi:MAG TPA: c-type cytochrome [Solirubrobacterales bacterium]|nr:c-type cytochrome [Solirubrobacterales bacterium]